MEVFERWSLLFWVRAFSSSNHLYGLRLRVIMCLLHSTGMGVGMVWTK